MDSVDHTADNFGVQYSQSMMGMQMACAYVGSTFMPPLFGLAAERISVTLYPRHQLLTAATRYSLYSFMPDVLIPIL